MSGDNHGEVVTYPPEDELPHGPEGDLWQESVYVCWWDADAGVGGVHRIGHEQHDGGQVALWNTILTADGTRHRRVRTGPLLPEYRLPTGFGSDTGHACTFDGQHQYWTWDEPDGAGHLRIEDFFPRMHNFPSNAGTLTKDFAAQHFETAGRIIGTVRVGQKTYAVNGLCYRDHSWGTRKFDTLLSHRWFTGTFGPHLSFGGMIWHGTDGSLGRFGLVVRDGVAAFATDVDILAYIEPDGITHRGGEMTLTLPGDEQIHITARPIDGVVQVIHNIASVDQLCVAEHRGQTGFCVLEMTNNPRNGSGPILASIQACNVDGLSQRPADTPRR